MNRVRRRAAIATAKQRSRKTLERQIQDLHNEAGGLLGVYLISIDNISDWLIAGSVGDELACKMLRAVAHYLKEIDEQKPLCLTCDFEFSSSAPPSVFAIILSGRGDPENSKNALFWSLCADCAVRHAGNLNQVMAQSVRKIWPQAHMLDMVNFVAEAGRA
jgi:hypothetical protein